MILKQFFQISLIKTLIFNFYYFGWRGIKCPVFVYPNFKLTKLSGSVELEKFETGIIKLGVHQIGIFDKRSDYGIWQVTGKVSFKGECLLGSGTKISVTDGGVCIFGESFCTTANSEFICNNNLFFGDNVLVSWGCLFMDNDGHKMDPDNPPEPIFIGNHCWVGCRSVILKGCRIPRDCVIAANSTITKSFSESNIIIGGTNRILKKNVRWN